MHGSDKWKYWCIHRVSNKSSGLPFSTVAYDQRTRMQTQGTALLPYEYDGLSDVFRRTVKHEGVRGLFKGLTPNLLKVCLPLVSFNCRLHHLHQLHTLFIIM